MARMRMKKEWGINGFLFAKGSFHEFRSAVSEEKPKMRVLEKILLCTKYYIISNAYPHLVYSNLFMKVS